MNHWNEWPRNDPPTCTHRWGGQLYENGVKIGEWCIDCYTERRFD